MAKAGSGAPSGFARKDTSHPGDRGFWLVDVVAAREEACSAALGGMLAREKPLQRPVLVPPAVSIDKALLDAAEGELPALQALGLELRRIAPDAVSVRQLPFRFLSA